MSEFLDAAGKLDVDVISKFIGEAKGIWHAGPDQAYALANLQFNVVIEYVAPENSATPQLKSTLFSDTFLGSQLAVDWHAPLGQMTLVTPDGNAYAVHNLPQPVI